MDAGRYTFVIDIPPRFQADVEAGRSPTIQLNVDATAMSQAGRGAGYIGSVIAQEMQTVHGRAPRTAEPPVRLVTRAKFNPNLQDTWFIAVSQIINNITMLAIILSGAAVVREREHGTIEHLLVMPLHPSRHHAGQDLVERAGHRGRGDAVAALDRAGHAGCARSPGRSPLFMAGTVLYMFAIASLGIFLATIARSMPQFGLLAFPVFLVLNMLSGGTTPLDSMPRWLQNVMQFSPAAALRELVDGDPVSRRGLRRRLGSLRRSGGNRCGVLRRGPRALQADRERSAELNMRTPSKERTSRTSAARRIGDVPTEAVRTRAVP